MPTLPLFVSTFVLATCGLVYELSAGTLASYLLGDSVTQFSTVIGVYLSAMGVGSWLSKAFQKDLLGTFVKVELLVGLVGGCSAALLFLAFDAVADLRPLLYGVMALIGVLVGVEIPLLLRILKGRVAFKDMVSRVFALDYVGALLASLLFPLVLVPHVGLVRSVFIFGMLNAGVALWSLRLFRGEIARPAPLKAMAIGLLLFLGAGVAGAERLMSIGEEASFQGNVLLARSSPYQRIVLVRADDGLRLFLNGNLQFSAADEYRYHEALVHVGLGSLPHPKRVLVLGGGDGMAVREILRRPEVEHVTLVDLDHVMTSLFSSQELLTGMNGHSLTDPRVTVVNDDAFGWLRNNRQLFDFIVVDFPDPSNFSIGKLFTTAFFGVLQRSLADGGVSVVQASSPLYARKSYWCVVNTIRASGLEATPYHAYVPSFGEWGFVLATKGRFVPGTIYPDGLKFANEETVAGMLSFAPDMGPVATDINRLNDQVLVRYFDREWAAHLR